MIDKILNWRPSKVYHYIILINVVIFVIGTLFIPDKVYLNDLACYSLLSDKFRIWQPITSMFMHAGIMHLALNMFVLYTLGGVYEKMLGKNKFLILYFAAGIGGFLLSSFFIPLNIPSVGASGAIFGFLGASIILLPNEKFFIVFLPFFGIKAKYLLTAALLIELVLGLVYINSGIGHMCHFGGGLTGILFALYLKSRKNGKR